MYKQKHLRSWSFLLSFEQSEKRNVGDLDHLESYSGNITNGMAFSPEPRHQHLVVLFYVVQTTVVGHESRDLLTVLNELHTDALSNSRIGLFGFHTNLLEDNSFSVRSSSKGVGFESGSQMCFLVTKIVPSLFSSKSSKFSCDSNTTWFTHLFV